MDKEKSKKEIATTEYPEVKGNFSWDNFDLDKFFEDFDKVGKTIKEKKENDDKIFVQR